MAISLNPQSFNYNTMITFNIAGYPFGTIFRLKYIMIGASGIGGTIIEDSSFTNPSFLFPREASLAHPTKPSNVVMFTLEGKANPSDEYSAYEIIYGTANVDPNDIEFKPDIELVAHEDLETDIDTKFGFYVQGKSRLKATTDYEGKYGANITSQRLIIDNQNFYPTLYYEKTIETDIIYKSGFVELKLEATDSRGIKNTNTYFITVESYTQPRINSFSAQRSPDDDSESAVINATCTIQPLDNKNDKTYSIDYRQTSPTETSWSNLYSGTFNDYLELINETTNDIFLVDSIYQIRLTIEDYFGSSISIKNVEGAFSILSFNPSGLGLAIGTLSTNNNFRVAIPTDFSETPTVNGIPIGGGSSVLEQVYPIGSVYISVLNTNPSTLFGFGTWVAFAIGSTIVGVDINQTEFDSVEKMGGSKTHTLATTEIPSHNHSLGTKITSNAGNHTHTFSDITSTVPNHVHSISLSTSSAGSHSHAQNEKTWVNSSPNVRMPSSGSFFSSTVAEAGEHRTSTDGSHTHTVSGTSAESGTHYHGFSGTTSEVSAHSHTVTGDTNNTGGGNAHNNLQPYITVYMWKRTA